MDKFADLAIGLSFLTRSKKVEDRFAPSHAPAASLALRAAGVALPPTVQALAEA